MTQVQLKTNLNLFASPLKLVILLLVMILAVFSLIACQQQNNQNEDLGHVELVPVDSSNDKVIVIKNSESQNEPLNSQHNTQKNQDKNTQLTHQKEAVQSKNNVTESITTNDAIGNKGKNSTSSQKIPQSQNGDDPGQSVSPNPTTDANTGPSSSDGYGNQGTQITKVKYKNQNGQSIDATFKTSAIGNLEAQVTLPDGRQVNLVAPQAGGNNPIYESDNGSVVLVSHSGGGSIDLLVNGEPMEFEAITADAEVVMNEP